MGQHHYRPVEGSRSLDVTTDTAGWRFLNFSVVELAPGETYQCELADRESAVVPLEGSGRVRAGAVVADLSRASVFTSMPSVVYAPPKTAIEVTTDVGFTFSIGSAPAQGKYPVRVFEPHEMKSEIRGGGTALRQVNHILAMPLPAEHLILYEVYVPRGTWAGWAPHCHDGRQGSPYLEEVYYFRMTPEEGFILQRNWRDDEGFDEQFVAKDGDAVLVTKGFHSTVACPTSHMYFLNYLAGDLFWQLPVVRP
jgi:5-deoxy-glucuronate isomerase